MGTPSASDLQSIAPQFIVAAIGMLVLLIDAIWPKCSKRALANVSVLGLIVAGIVGAALYPKGQAHATMQNMVMADGYTAFFTVVFALAGALGIWMSYAYLEKEGGNQGEYYALIMFVTSGALVMASSINLICIFIGLEILSIALYILAGYQTEKLKSDESALKYFLLGAFASAFFLYGIALIYGATGTVNLLEMSTRLSNASNTGVEHGKNFLLLAGIAMLIVGFGFKVAVVPFHIWTPDVYEGAPTSVTAYMSVGAKAAGFAAFLRVIAMAISDPSVQLQVSAVLASIAALTMLVGNVVAVVQPNIKRMLAYSSIAHAGYILCGLVAVVRPGGFGLPGNARQDAISAVLFYTLAYTVSNLGAFGVVIALRKKGQEVENIADLAGIGSRYPLLAAAMSLFMLSLAGLPPTAGFFGKLFLIRALISMNTPLVWLILLFVLTSVVSFYYYLGVVRTMYMESTDREATRSTSLIADWQMKLALGISAVGTLALGLWAGHALEIAQHVAQGFGGGGGPFALR